MRNIRINLEDKEAEMLDIIREKYSCTYRDLLLVHIETKRLKDDKKHRKS